MCVGIVTGEEAWKKFPPGFKFYALKKVTQQAPDCRKEIYSQGQKIRRLNQLVGKKGVKKNTLKKSIDQRKQKRWCQERNHGTPACHRGGGRQNKSSWG